MSLLLPISLVGGLAVAVVAWLWLIVRASREGVGWGLGSLLVPPAGLLFALRHAERAIGPLVLFVIGIVPALAALAFHALVPAIGKDQSWSDSLPAAWSMAVAALKSDAAHEWMEGRALDLQLGGAAVAAASWLWLIVRAFREQWQWGVGTLVLPPAGFVFAARHPRKGVAPLLLASLGILAAAAPPVYTLAVPLDLGPRETMVAGERHITLTGWDRKDYSALKQRPDVSVLQMANADVTDQTLESLRGMKVLHKLDLNDTQVTDAGLIVLRDLPALAELYLARTRITDQGFRDALFAKDSLMRLDLSGTQVSHETVRAWRDARPGRKAMP